MMEKLFIGTDVVPDIVLKREPFFPDSRKVLALIERTYFSGFTSSPIIANCYHVINSNRDKKTALKTISKLRSILNVLPFTDKKIEESLNSRFEDFEDLESHASLVCDGIREYYNKISLWN